MADTKKTKKKTTGQKATGKKSTTKKTTRKTTAAGKSTTASKAKQQEPKPAVEEPKQAEKQETSEEKLRKVGDRLSEAADKGVETLREVFGKVRDFSVDATELTRLKVEIHRLRGDRDRMLTVMGEKLWELRNSEKLSGLKEIFEDDFNKLDELSKDIENKEKTASKISL